MARNEIVTVGDIPGARACDKADWQLGGLAESGGLLKSKGIEKLPTTSCRAVIPPWLPSARIVQFRGVQQTDVFVGVTLLRASPGASIRAIPFFGGLVLSHEVENDPANKSAFNELLRSIDLRRKDVKQQTLNVHLTDIAETYMFCAGHLYKPQQTTLQHTLESSQMHAAVETKGESGVVTLYVVPGGLRDGRTRSWNLTFQVAGTHPSLARVVAEEQ